MLKGWFLLNESGKHESTYIPRLYVETPEHYTWEQKTGKRKTQVRGPSNTIGCVVNLSPSSGDIYFMRMLLHHQFSLGKLSFKDSKTNRGVVFPTFKDVCNNLGLLDSDVKWSNTMHDISQIATGRGMIIFFVRYCYLGILYGRRTFLRSIGMAFNLNLCI
jgi:hypothetical protein